MRIREYKKEDEKKVKELIKSVLTDIYGETSVGKWEDFSKYIIFYIIEEENGEVIGTAGLKKINKDICKLKRMYVKCSLQRKGIGSKLLDKIIAYSQKMKFKKMILTTYPEMLNAIKFYGKKEFIIIKNAPDYYFTYPNKKEYNARQVVMERNLK
jgi:putative acetyltransferase